MPNAPALAAPPPSAGRRLWGHSSLRELEELAAQAPAGLQSRVIEALGERPDVEELVQLAQARPPHWDQIAEALRHASPEALIAFLRHPPTERPGYLLQMALLAQWDDPEEERLAQAADPIGPIWRAWDALLDRIETLQREGPTALHPLTLVLWESPLLALPRRDASGRLIAPDHQDATGWALTNSALELTDAQAEHHATWLERLRHLTTPARNWIRAQGAVATWPVDVQRQVLAVTATSVAVAHQVLPAIHELTLPLIARLSRVQPALQPESLLVGDAARAVPEPEPSAGATARLRMAQARLEHAVRPAFEMAPVRATTTTPRAPRPWGEQLLVVTGCDRLGHGVFVSQQSRRAWTLRTDEEGEALREAGGADAELEAVLRRTDTAISAGGLDADWGGRIGNAVERLRDARLDAKYLTSAQERDLRAWLEPWAAQWDAPASGESPGDRRLGPSPRWRATQGEAAPQTGPESAGQVEARWAQELERMLPLLHDQLGTWGRDLLLRLAMGCPSSARPVHWLEAQEERRLLRDEGPDPALVRTYWAHRATQSLEAAAYLASALPKPWGRDEVEPVRARVLQRLTNLAQREEDRPMRSRMVQREASTYLGSALVPLDVIRQLLEANRWPQLELLMAMAGHPQAKRDAVCREHLRCCPYPQVWGALILEAPEQPDVPELVAQLVAADKAGLSHLDAFSRLYPERLLEVLEVNGVRPMLSSAHADVRLWAVQYLGRLQDRPPTADGPTPPRRPR